MATEREDQTATKSVMAGRAPEGVDHTARAAYEAGLRDRAKLSGAIADPTVTASVGPSEGTGGGGNVDSLPAEPARESGR